MANPPMVLCTVAAVASDRVSLVPLMKVRVGMSSEVPVMATVLSGLMMTEPVPLTLPPSWSVPPFATTLPLSMKKPPARVASVPYPVI